MRTCKARVIHALIVTHSLSQSPSSRSTISMAVAKPSSFLILHPRGLGRFFSLSSTLYSSSSSSIQFNRARAIPVPSHRYRSSVAAAAAAAGGRGGGRSGALAPAPAPGALEVQRIDVNPPKGTRDFPPEEMRLRNWLFLNFREVFWNVSFVAQINAILGYEIE